MDLQLSDVQHELVAAVGAVCRRHFAWQDLLERAWSSPVVEPGGWGALDEVGVFGLRASEHNGGLGLGLADAAVVFEELGRFLVPGPVVATEMARAHGLPGAGRPVGPGAGSPPVGWWRRDDPDGLVADVEDLHGLIVVDDERRRLTWVDGEELRALPSTPVARPLDPLVPLRRFGVLPEGRPVDLAYDQWLVELRVLTAALCVGIASATLDLAVAHAGQRHQFGRPIGSFQAVKHLCVDLLVRSEMARAAVHVAAVTADQPGVGDVHRAAAAAALVATDAAVANARGCLQVHGGLGFTWEMPVHLYLTRAKQLAIALGPQRVLAATVADAL
jgi:alkylation response protein AidB-like acyl-CoA dehydrogenase